MNDNYINIINKLKSWETGGKRILPNGTLQICHVPHVAPEAWLHKIYQTKENNHIQLIEDATGLLLPDFLREFYQYANGINIFSNSLCVYGYRPSLYVRVGDEAIQPYDMIEINKDLKRWKIKDVMMFGGYSWDGSEMIFDISKTNSNVFRCDFDKKPFTILNEWESFEQWLSTEVERLSKLFDENGRRYNKEVPTTPKNDYE